MACELCRFYSISYFEVMNLDCDVFDTMYLGMETIKARETLSSFSSSDWSHMKQSDRSKMHRKIYAIAYPEEMKQKALTEDSLASFVGLKPEMMRKNNGRK